MKSLVQSFIFLKILPSTHHKTILRLCHFHLSYSAKNDKKSCLKYSIHCCFPTYFPASFLSRLPTQVHASGFSHQTKVYRTDMRNKMPLYHDSFLDRQGEWRLRKLEKFSCFYLAISFFYRMLLCFQISILLEWARETSLFRQTTTGALGRYRYQFSFLSTIGITIRCL